MHFRKTSKNLVDQAGDLVERVTPHVEQARERLVEDYLPAAQGAVAGAVAGARDAVPVVQEAYQNTRDAALAGARERLPQTRQKSHRGRTLLMALGLAGLAAGAVKLLKGRQADRTLPYVPPTPAPHATTSARPATTGTSAGTTTGTSTGASTAGSASAAAATAAAADEDPLGSGTGSSSDAGGSAPGEALADEQDGPHPVTTPDAPADAEEVEDPRP